jgi:hypothetical protein
MYVTAGTEYEVYVLDSGSCMSGTFDYKIMVDTSSDPSLVLEASGTRYYWSEGVIHGNAAITW